MNSMKTIFLALATAFVLFSCSPKTTGNKGIIPENANELASENLSFAGIFKRPKGMAIAGLVISLIGIIMLVFVFGILMVAAASK